MIEISEFSGRIAAQIFLRPLSSTIQAFVRRILPGLTPRTGSFEAFARASAWFPNLKVCDVKVAGFYRFNSEDRDLFREIARNMSPIKIKTEKLVLEHYFGYNADHVEFAPGTTAFAEIQERLMAKITVDASDNERIHEFWERFTVGHRDRGLKPTPLEHFDTWPAFSDHDGFPGITRRTVQLVGRS